MSCHSKEELEQMLEDVVNELTLSDEMIARHGPLGTPPAELVREVLAQKDQTIRMLRRGFVDAGEPSSYDPHDIKWQGGDDQRIGEL